VGTRLKLGSVISEQRLSHARNATAPSVRWQAWGSSIHSPFRDVHGRNRVFTVGLDMCKRNLMIFSPQASQLVRLTLGNFVLVR
jgi:hypothetical protein